MNLRQLEIFSSVMRCRTTIAAAEELSMSQSAVSNAIKHVESQLGFKLFERISNRLVPTEEAKLLLEEAEPLFHHQQAVNQRAADLKAGRIGRIRVVATAELSESILPAVMAQFLKLHPAAYLSLDTRPLNSVLDAVESGLADVGFGMEAHERHGLSLKPIAELTTVCVCQQGSSLAALPFITPGDLREQNLIAPHTSNGIGLLVAEAFSKAAAPYSPTVEVRFLNVAARLVQENWGVALLDEMTASSGRYSDLAIRPFQPRVRLALSAILPKQRVPSRLANAFISIFQKQASSRLTDLQALIGPLNRREAG
ncbi:LysR substrate-binding domain-containing protein [Aquamicrobium sp. LC103]|uniref:LysR family transcriptional regulator n=1 Tax=Aquamicrobium sp. LC103 TaxID=1120658 RepID=UPI00063EC55A|nr:LysR substrate-binding domain-containing protein [Aquamicrobium sp. LC103]TKT74401.1 LysR family transcriptional regulator [Aquamicrobium sp. LC103]